MTVILIMIHNPNPTKTTKSASQKTRSFVRLLKVERFRTERKKQRYWQLYHTKRRTWRPEDVQQPRRRKYRSANTNSITHNKFNKMSMRRKLLFVFTTTTYLFLSAILIPVSTYAHSSQAFLALVGDSLDVTSRETKEKKTKHPKKLKSKSFKNIKKPKGTKSNKKNKKSKKTKKTKKPKVPKQQHNECKTSLSPSIDLNTTLALKSTVYGGLQLNQAVRFVSRQDLQTPLSFQTTEFLWYAWEVSSDKLALLQEELPDGFTLSKISVEKGEESKYYIVLNLYNVIIAGNPSIRAEWSTFVQNDEDNDTKVYFMILDAPTTAAAFEPTSCNLIEPKNLMYESANGGITTSIQARGGNFTSQITFSDQIFHVDSSFQTASDKNYWLSGIYDTAFFNGDLLASTIVSANPENVDDDYFFEDTTYWSTLVKSNVPDHTFYYLDPVKFVLNPWFNLHTLQEKNNELYTCLDGFKYNMAGFAGLSFLQAQGVADGTSQTLLNYDFLDGSGVPSVYVNFKLKKRKRKDVQALIGDHLKLAKTSMMLQQEDGSTAKTSYVMTLRISKGGISSSEFYGLRADWIVYVQCEETGRVYQMILDTQSSVSSLDLSTFQEVPPAPVFELDYKVDDSIHVNVTSAEDSNVYLSLDLTNSGSMDHSQSKLNPNWLFTHDRVYSPNGLYDNFLFDARLYDMEAISIPLSNVVFSSSLQLMDMVRSDPVEAFVTFQNVKCILEKWYNLKGK